MQHGLTRERIRVLAVYMRNKLRARCINFYVVPYRERRPGSSLGIVTDYGLDGLGIESRWGEIFRPSRPAWFPTSLLYNGYGIFSRGKVRPGRAADHSPPSSAEVLEEQSYTSIPRWATTGPVTEILYFTYLPYREHLVLPPRRPISECCISICKISKEYTNT
jgi:hypothetical protein